VVKREDRLMSVIWAVVLTGVIAVAGVWSLFFAITFLVGRELREASFYASVLTGILGGSVGLVAGIAYGIAAIWQRVS
jgi:hypothetical protein